jgi:crotonobetainyl-CoA:carnitine CoA-transferase CaiB-like acyl-CoA transferase
MIRDNLPVQNGKGGRTIDRSAYFLSLNRNKYGLPESQTPRAVKIFRTLFQSDVVLENYAPGHEDWDRLPGLKKSTRES